MEFVHPEILWGLGALAIPIAIHLLHFRRFRRVRFSQVAFLKAVQRETKATQQIRHWWILLLRLLAFAALILAFSQPTLISGSQSREGGSAGNAVALYVDNSLSMEGTGEEGQLLQSARNKAALVVEQYKPSDRFQVITNEFSGRDQVFLTRDQALERIESIQPSAFTQPIDAVMGRIEHQLTQSIDRTRTAYLFSDLQQNTHAALIAAESDSPPDTSIHWMFVPELAGATPNIWVDSVWFDQPMHISNRPAALRVRVRHTSKTAANGIPLSLEINGARVALGTCNLVPGLPTDTVLRFTHDAAGVQRGTVHIEDAPIRFDDTWFFGYTAVDRIRIAVLTPDANSAASASILRAFGTAPELYDVRIQSTWSPGDFAEDHLVILAEWPAQTSGFANSIQAQVANGSSLIILPASHDADASLLTALGADPGNDWVEGSDRVQSLALDHPFFDRMFARTPERMDLPNVERLWDRRLNWNESILAKTERGKPFLTQLPVGRGTAFVFSASLKEDETNLTRHALWVPLLLRIAEQSAAGTVSQGTLGTLEAWSVGLDLDRTDGMQLVGTRTWLPEIRQTGRDIRVALSRLNLEPGHYTLEQDETAYAALGLNYDRRESDNAAFDPSKLEAHWRAMEWNHLHMIAATGSALPHIIQRMEQGTPLWKALIMIALIALALEALFLRIWKHSSKA